MEKVSYKGHAIELVSENFDREDGLPEQPWSSRRERGLKRYPSLAGEEPLSIRGKRPIPTPWSWQNYGSMGESGAETVARRSTTVLGLTDRKVKKLCGRALISRQNGMEARRLKMNEKEESCCTIDSRHHKEISEKRRQAFERSGKGRHDAPGQNPPDSTPLQGS